ncbi:MAG: SMC family ATPase [Candidatus Micrarchaeota archaeon]
MITRLHMKRWKSHEDTEMHFGKGSNLFIGKMGSGKSSAIDAISFALFGTFPALKSRKVKLEELVMQRPRKHASAEIELEFTIGGKKYKIIRHAGSKTTGAQLFEEGKLLEAQTSRVTELVESLLKIDYDLFSRIIYAEQNRIDYLLTLPKGDRKKQVDELLGISKFEEARANAGNAINKLIASRLELERYLEGANAIQLKLQKEKHEKDAEKAREDLHQKQHVLSENQEKLRHSRRMLAELEAAEHEYRRAERDLSSTEALISEKRKELESEGVQITEEELNKLRISLQALEKSLQEGRNGQEKASTALSEAVAALDLQRLELQKWHKNDAERMALIKAQAELGSIEQLKGKLANLEADSQSQISALSKFEAEKSELSKSLESLHSAEAKCPICDSDLPSERKSHLQAEKKAHAAHLEAEMRNLKKTYESNKAGILDAKRVLEEAQLVGLKLKEFSDSEGVLKKISQKIADFERQVPELGERKENAASEIASLQAEHSEKMRQLLKLERIPKLRKEMASLEEKQRNLNQLLKSNKFKPEDISEGRNVLLKLEKESSTLNAEISSHSNSLSDITSILNDLGKKLIEMQGKEALISQLQEKIVRLSGFQEAIIETQAEMRMQLIEAMNEAMNSLWPSIYPYGDYKRLRIRTTEDDYLLELNALEDEWIPIENCSGGEKSCAALTLRVAFAMVLTPNLSWLILDEPTHNLDSRAVQLLNRALHDEIPKIVEQTFVITHDEALKEGASSKVFYFERDKDNSDRSVVEEISSAYS